MSQSFEELRKESVAEWEALQKTPKTRILVGTATCGQAAGAMAVLDALNKQLSEKKIDAVVTQVGCIGLCYTEPLVDIIKPGKPRISYGAVTPDIMNTLVQDYIIGENPHPELALGTMGDGAIEGIPKFWELPMLKPQVRIVLRNCGFIDPTSIRQYVANSGYSGLLKALTMTPDQIIAEIKKSGLKGRGGAGFLTGQKWEFCQKAAGKEKYIICNADEGDPGAFMNRSLLEGDPHSVLEGMVIGAYAIGANKGYIYCRAEYPLAVERLNMAIKQMHENGMLGDHVLGSNFSFDLEVKEGAGAFVCGEETALMASIEGKRGMPRPRPPFPANAGLFGKPTNINNVETWADAAIVMQKGSDWYSSYGPTNAKGTKTFALVGKVNRTGLIEVPLGMKLGTVINEIGGGIVNNKKFKGVQSGGPSGGCLPAKLQDLTIDYDSLGQAGAIMGSGGLVVADEDTCMVDMARFFMTFVQEESCGKCVPCRVGTKQMLYLLEKITKGKGEEGDIEKLEKLAQLCKAASLCGLGQTAPNPVLSTLRYFRDEYEAHIKEKRCPALACSALTAYYILQDKCEGCGICHQNCPVEAIAGGKRMVHVINQERCIKCGTCMDMCPKRFGAVVKVSGEKVAVPKEPIPVGVKAPQIT